MLMTIVVAVVEDAAIRPPAATGPEALIERLVMAMTVTTFAVKSSMSSDVTN